MSALARAIATIIAMEGRATPLQVATHAAEIAAERRPPWWGWTSHLAAAIALRTHGLEPA